MRPGGERTPGCLWRKREFGASAGSGDGWEGAGEAVRLWTAVE